MNQFSGSDLPLGSDFIRNQESYNPTSHERWHDMKVPRLGGRMSIRVIGIHPSNYTELNVSLINTAMGGLISPCVLCVALGE